MTFDTSASGGIGPVPREKSRDFIAMAFRPWQLLVRKMAKRKTRMSLSALDDHLLKDIGISRGIIDRVARNHSADAASLTGRGNQHPKLPNSTQGERP